MKVHRLQLLNFRQYTELDVSFGDGITAIVGANGSGKSTLLEAICWALYGAEALRSKVEEVRPLFASMLENTHRMRGTASKATLTFSLGENTYEVERSATGARLYRLVPSREAIAEGTTAVNTSVKRLLGGMTYRQFLTSFFAQQGEIEFLNFDKARRREEVLRMLGLERVTRSVKWIEDQLSLKRSELRGQQSLPIDPKEAQRQLVQAREELATAQEDLRKGESELQTSQSNKEHYTPVASEWEAKKKAYDSLQMQVQLLQHKQQTETFETERLNKEVAEARAASARLEHLRPQGERYKQLRERLRQLEDLQSYEQRRVQLQAQIDNLQPQITEKRQQLAQLQQEHADLQQRKQALQLQEQHLQQLSEQVRQAEQLRQQIETLDERRLQVQNRLSALQAKIVSLQQQVEQARNQIAQREEVPAQLERTESLLQEAESRVVALEKELAKLEQHRAGTIASAEAEAKNLYRQIDEVQRKRQNIEALGADGRCPVCTRPLGEEYIDVLQHFDFELAALEQQLQSALSRKAETERDTEAITLCRSSLDEARTELQQYRDQLITLQEQIRQRELWKRQEQSLEQQIAELQQQYQHEASTYDEQQHAQLRQQYEQLQHIVQQAEAEHKLWQERHTQWQKDFTRIDEAMRQLQTMLAQAENQIIRAEAEIAKLPKGYDAALHDELRREMEKLQPVWDEALSLQPVASKLSQLQERLAETQKTLQQTQEQLNQTHQELSNLAYDPQEYESVMQQFQRYDEAVRNATINVSVLQERERQLTENVAILEEQWQRLQEHLSKIQELERQVRRDEFVRNAMRNLADMLNSEVVPELEERAGELLNLLTDGRYTQLKISDDFEFTLIDEYHPKPIISGGENDIANLSLRLAMAEMICERSGQPLGLLVLDEVFGSLDDDRRQNTLQLLRRLRDRFEQIIIISHIEEIQSGADRCLRVDYDIHQRRSDVREVSAIGSELLLDDDNEELFTEAAIETSTPSGGRLFEL